MSIQHSTGNIIIRPQQPNPLGDETGHFATAEFFNDDVVHHLSGIE